MVIDRSFAAYDIENVHPLFSGEHLNSLRLFCKIRLAHNKPLLL